MTKSKARKFQEMSRNNQNIPEKCLQKGQKLGKTISITARKVQKNVSRKPRNYHKNGYQNAWDKMCPKIAKK